MKKIIFIIVLLFLSINTITGQNSKPFAKKSFIKNLDFKKDLKISDFKFNYPENTLFSTTSVDLTEVEYKGIYTAYDYFSISIPLSSFNLFKLKPKKQKHKDIHLSFR